jgi:hypothetical protein
VTKIEEVGTKALDHMLNRSGVGDMLSEIRDSDPETWREIVTDTARAAIAALMEPSVSELARDLVVWHGMNGGVPTGKSLYDYFDGCGVNAPAWLREAITNDDLVPPKATRAAAIHRAMLQAALDEGKEGTS